MAELTQVEASHLLTLLRENEREGWYYGNREQYWARHGRIVEKISALIAPDSTRVNVPD